MPSASKLLDKLRRASKDHSSSPKDSNSSPTTNSPSTTTPTETVAKSQETQPEQKPTSTMAPSIPSTMKAVVIEKAGAPLQLKEVPVPQPEPNEILIKVKACGVCHSDSAVQQGTFPGNYPLIPGHEVIGTVVKLGSAVTKWKEGDIVGGAWHGGHDGTCKACNRALYQMCENEQINGVTRNGGYAEYCTLRTEATVRIPPSVSATTFAPLLCAGVTTFNGIRQMDIIPGDTIAIQGLGGLGHLAVQYARKMGYRTVALSSSAAKKDFAFELGATDFVDGS